MEPEGEVMLPGAMRPREEDPFAAMPEVDRDVVDTGALERWQQRPDAEIEVRDPTEKLRRWITAQNIAKELDESVLGPIGQMVKLEAELDETSRAEWKENAEKSLKMGMQKSEPKNYPWPKASSVVYPLITTAAMQFAARAYPAIVSNKAVVKGVILGRDDGVPAVGPDGQQIKDPQSGEVLFKVPPGALQARADRIGSHMSWQLLDEMTEWEPETDQLLHQFSILGTYFRKTYWDPSVGRNRSLIVSPLKLILNYWAKSLETAPRATEVLEYYPYQIREFERAGLWLERRFTPDPGAQQPDPDAPVVFYEQHRWLDLDGDNYPEPYTVTVDKEGSQVVRIVARYDETSVQFGESETGVPRVVKIEPLQFYTQYNFLPSLDGGIYGTGFGQLLGPINASVNTALNMLLDAGHLANTNGGFIAKSLSMQAGSMRWTMGEFKPVNAGGQDLRSSILPLPFAGPNQVLFALLGTLIEAGKDVASVKDVLAGEAPQANVPATTVLALIEQGQKVFTAIFKRTHRALKSELSKLYRLNRLHLPAEVEFRINEQWLRVTREDYELGAGVEPISDPTMVSDMQQLGRAQYLMQFRGDPLIVQGELTKRLLKAAQIDDLDKLMNANPSPPPGLIAKQKEIEQEDRRIDAEVMLKKAQTLAALTQGALNLAKADESVGDQNIAWVTAQLSILQTEFEQSMRRAEVGQSDDGSAGGGGGHGGPGVPRLAAPPGDGAGAAVPGGPLGAAMGGTPTPV